MLSPHSNPTPEYALDDTMPIFAKETIMDRYLQEGETSPQDAYMRTAMAFASDYEHGLRMYDYSARKKWLGFASPTLSNSPKRTNWYVGEDWAKNFDADCFQTTRMPMPISCFLNTIPDSRDGIARHYSENIWLNSQGGGIGSYAGKLRQVHSKTTTGQKTGGAIPFIGVKDRLVLAVAQGSNRRGADCVYLDVWHPEIEEFIALRNEGGDASRRTRNLHIGVNIDDAFMNAALANAQYGLRSPQTNEIVGYVDAAELLGTMLDTANNRGEPFLHFVDNTRRNMNPISRELGHEITHPNLCTEILQYANALRTAVCCLSSVNLVHIDEYKDNYQFFKDVAMFLDNVLEYFIRNASRYFEDSDEYTFFKLQAREVLSGYMRSEEDVEKAIQELISEALNGMAKAVFGASQERSIGLGIVGWHTALQERNLPVDCAAAKGFTSWTSKAIKTHMDRANFELGAERGEAPDMAGSGRRFTNTIAIAPTATLSIMTSTHEFTLSEGRSLLPRNRYTHKTLSGTYTVVNKTLGKVLKKYGMDTPEVWDSIGFNKGSVLHLPNLTPWEKDVFRTAYEVDMSHLIDHYAIAQEFVCQAQSLTLFYPRGTSRTKLLFDTFKIWKSGLPTRYYMRGESGDKAQGVTTVEKGINLHPVNEELHAVTCTGCE